MGMSPETFRKNKTAVKYYLFSSENLEDLIRYIKAEAEKL